jgi:hypothetical protein
MLHKLRIALAVTLVALAAVSAADSASAGFMGGGRYFGFMDGFGLLGP